MRLPTLAHTQRHCQCESLAAHPRQSSDLGDTGMCAISCKAESCKNVHIRRGVQKAIFDVEMSKILL